MKSPLKEEVDEKGREIKVIENDWGIRYQWINRRMHFFLISIALDNIII